jgi:hypothetical protein
VGDRRLALTHPVTDRPPAKPVAAWVAARFAASSAAQRRHHRAVPDRAAPARLGSEWLRPATRQAAQEAADVLRQAEAAPEGEGPPAPRLGRLAGAVTMPAADNLRRSVRRAAWQPQAMLRSLWARFREAWRGR